MKSQAGRRWPYLIPLLVVALGSIPTFEHGCFWRATIGVPCPACGLSRATERLFHGDFAGAWQMHPLIYLLLPLAILGGVGVAMKLWQRKKGIAFTWPRQTRTIACGVLVIFYLTFIVRLLLLYPHTEPLVWNGEALLPTLVRLIRQMIEAITVR